MSADHEHPSELLSLLSILGEIEGSKFPWNVAIPTKRWSQVLLKLNDQIASLEGKPDCGPITIKAKR